MFGLSQAERFERQGRIDAERGVDQFQLHADAQLGPEPVFSPATNHHHRQVAADLREGDIVEDVGLDLDGLNRDMAGQPTYGTLVFALGGAVALETWGAVLVLRSMGVRPAERLPLGLGLSLAVIGLTALVAKHSNGAGPGTEGGSTAGGAKRFGVLAVYLVLGIAVAVVRLTSAENEAQGIVGAAWLVLSLALSLGPAWMTELIIRRLPRVRELHRRRGLVRQRLKTASSRVASAQRFLSGLAAKSDRWHARAAPLRAAYRRGQQTSRQSADGPAAPDTQLRLRR